MPIHCPLCRSAQFTTQIRGADARAYHLCGGCSLIFVDPPQLPARAVERARYETHENSIKNKGYVRFLNRLVEPMLRYLDRGMQGLDDGCGPGPTLSLLLQRHGVSCENYDPIFADRALTGPYDFVVSTECFEHFHRPLRDIKRICGLLRPGGVLGVMTESWHTPEQFATWYYTKDTTHTSFYHEDTFTFISDTFGLERLWTDGERVFIFRRRSRHSG